MVQQFDSPGRALFFTSSVRKPKCLPNIRRALLWRLFRSYWMWGWDIWKECYSALLQPIALCAASLLLGARVAERGVGFTVHKLWHPQNG